jgi:hypothetical protein
MGPRMDGPCGIGWWWVNPLLESTVLISGQCWICLPVLIYQSMVPAWSRATKLQSPYAYAALDGLFTILWFSAFIAVASWNSQGVKAGESKGTDPSGGCSSFEFGSETKCRLSETTVGFGVIIF